MGLLEKQPTDILGVICQFLSFSEIITLSTVSKRFNLVTKYLKVTETSILDAFLDKYNNKSFNDLSDNLKTFIFKNSDPNWFSTGCICNYPNEEWWTENNTQYNSNNCRFVGYTNNRYTHECCCIKAQKDSSIECFSPSNECDCICKKDKNDFCAEIRCPNNCMKCEYYNNNYYYK